MRVSRDRSRASTHAEPALRRDFPWRRVPGYIVVQLAGATLAALVLHAIINVSARYGSNYPASGYSAGAAFWMEFILTTGLVSVILGTASGVQNVGVIGAFGVGSYIALAGLSGSLRGRGGDKAALGAAQGELFTETYEPGKS
jgi:glycerol uptake facilitator-like aquaporin